MIVATTEADVLAGVLSGLGVIVAAIVVQVARIGSRLARIEEWIRVQERRNGN